MLVSNYSFGYCVADESWMFFSLVVGKYIGSEKRCKTSRRPVDFGS